jgi:hypothetical protein
MSLVPQHRRKIGQRGKSGRESGVIPRHNLNACSLGAGANRASLLEQRSRPREQIRVVLEAIGEVDPGEILDEG